MRLYPKQSTRMMVPNKLLNATARSLKLMLSIEWLKYRTSMIGEVAVRNIRYHFKFIRTLRLNFFELSKSPASSYSITRGSTTQHRAKFPQ
jgi:hypothetical protein